MQLNSKNQTILLVSDVHQEVDKLQHILNNENYDIAVCLGDFFDSHTHNTHKDVIKTVAFLEKWMFKENFYALFGNHDLMYFYINKHTICSGYTDWKFDLIRNVLGEKFGAIQDKFLWYIWVDNFLCTHAGLHSCHLNLNLNVEDKTALSKWLDVEVIRSKNSLITGIGHWTYRAGAARGGNQPYGGLTWLDSDREFEPINGLKQIFGHTAHSKILLCPHDQGIFNANFEKWNNINIDCHLNEYLLIKNGKLEIKKYIDL